MNLIEKAIITATKAHEKQFRKKTKIPYIIHPYSVGMILMKNGCKDELVAAGLLHDTVEDTDITLEDIEREFGSTVAEIVKGCSEPDKKLSWEERKEHTLAELKTASLDIRLVACADKIHNIRSIRDDLTVQGKSVWKKFSRGKIKQEWYYKGLVESLGYASRFELLEQLEEEVELLFGSDEYELIQ
jgi:(p)ppGpp synthase/HD superfamily hydrolase